MDGLPQISFLHTSAPGKCSKQETVSHGLNEGIHQSTTKLPLDLITLQSLTLTCSISNSSYPTISCVLGEQQHG